MERTVFLFDMNGVLVDDEQLQESAFRQVLAPLGLHLSPADYIRYFIGKTDKKGLEDYAAAVRHGYAVEELIRAKGVAYKELSTHGITGYQGVTAFVKALADAGARMAVVTSSTRAEADAVLKGLKLTEYFPVIIAAEDITNGKPDPEGYRKGAEALSASPNQCVVVEDAPSGIQAGRAAGMFTLAITNTHDEQQLEGADLIIGELSAPLISKL